MNVTKALEDITYIKSLCKEARGTLYTWRPHFILYSILLMFGLLIPILPGITTAFSLDGKHWPILFLIGIAGALIINKNTKTQPTPFMMRLLLWNWSLLFLFAIAALFWNNGGYSSIQMYSYWLMVIGTAFLMTGVTLQTRIGWIGLGFFIISLIPTDVILSIWYIFIPSPSGPSSIEPPVFIFKSMICALLLAMTWWLITRQKAGSVD